MKKDFGKIIQNKKGQTTVTIPKALVSALNIKKGMNCKWEIDKKRNLVLKIKESKK